MWMVAQCGWWYNVDGGTMWMVVRCGWWYNVDGGTQVDSGTMWIVRIYCAVWILPRVAVLNRNQSSQKCLI